MKTAMQELRELIEMEQKEPTFTYDEILAAIDELLAKERQQIEDAYKASDDEVNPDKLYLKLLNADASDYYNKNYNQ